MLVNGEGSSWCNVSSGIPQGSVLGPVRFVILINDLPDDIDSTVKIYVDDTKIYRQARTLSDNTTMQADLEALKNWSQKWQLRFNGQKCNVMHLGSHPEGQPISLGKQSCLPLNVNVTWAFLSTKS